MARQDLPGPERVVPLSRKDAALLAYIGLNGTAPSVAVAGLLWPQSDERGAMNSLRQRLYRLRRDTGARLLEVTATARLADDLALEDRPAPAALEADPAAWDDELLGSFSYDDASEFSTWLDLQRRSWAGARVEAIARIASEAESQGQLARALLYAQRLRAHEPLSEHVHRRLMRLHYLRGDRAAAVAAFECCERVLKDELGLAPGAETLALLDTVGKSGPAESAMQRRQPVPPGLLKPPRTVGRAAEFERLLAALHDGENAVLVGEAGMGKTRLLQDLVAALPDAVYAQARAGDAGVPFCSLARVMRAVASARPAALLHAQRAELARVLPAFENRDGAVANALPVPVHTLRLQQSVEKFLASGAGPDGATLVLDDLHFADRASLETLLALIDADALAGFRWVLGHRPVGAAEDDAALLRTLADAPRTHWIALSGLTEPDLVELLDTLALPGLDAATLAAPLARHSGGNPLYVLETLRAARKESGAGPMRIALPRPDSIAHLIDRRLQRLSENALSLGRVAALAGPDFSPGLAEHALATPAMRLASAWAELEAADVLRGNDFSHDLVRDGMLRATPHTIAVHAHRLIAQFLQDRGCEPARVAAHLLAGESYAPAARGFRTAANRAHLAGQPRAQAALLLRSADAFDLAGDATTAFEMRSLALRPMLASQGLGPADALSQQLVEAAGSGALAGLAWTRRASLLMNAGQAARAEVAGRQALERVPPAQQALHIEAISALAIACVGRGKAQEGLALMRPWVDRVADIADPLSRIEFCSAHAVVLHHLELVDEAARALALQITLIRASGEHGELVPALLSQAALELRRGDPDRALQLADEAAAAQADADPADMVRSYTLFLSGSALCAQGRYEEGLSALETACAALAQSMPGTPVHSNAEVVIADVLLQLGQTARAGRWLAAEHPALSPAAQFRRTVARAAVRRVVSRGLEAEPGLDAITEGHAGMLARIELARRLEPAAAILACEQLRTQAGRNGDRVVDLLAAMVRLDALRAAGVAETMSAAALELERLLGDCRSTLVYPPAVWLACALAHAAAGQHAPAMRCRMQARQWIRRIALPNVADAFRDAFMHRHPENVALLAEPAVAAQDPAGAP